MNPEFQRNLWLNLSAGRLVIMPVTLGAVFVALALLPEQARTEAVQGAAQLGYWLLVIVWGTWLSARAVITEIRERTWDGQRMSAIAPWTMVWGKLFGAPIYAWYGGVFCLLVILADSLGRAGPGETLLTLGYYLLLGVFAHAVALLASLLAVRRRLHQANLGVFLYQLFGIVAAALVASLWPANWLTIPQTPLPWYGLQIPPAPFALASIAAFVLWAIIGNYRLMRQELQFTYAPWVWIGFMVFLMGYAAGFVDIVVAALTQAGLAEPAAGGWQQPLGRGTVHLLIATGVAALLAYLMLFSDSKDTVNLRWISQRLRAGALFAALSRLPSWGWAVLAASVGTVILLALGQPLRFDPAMLSGPAVDTDAFGLADGVLEWQALMLAGLFFLLRDTAIVLAFNISAGTQRADVAAFITLLLLYFFLPVIVLGTNSHGLQPFFWPSLQQAPWLATLPPLAEAVIAWGIVGLRLRRLAAVR